MDTSKEIIINNTKLNIFLNENTNIKQNIHQYTDNAFHCCVCLDDNIEKDNIVQYNHCGNIYIHEGCLYDWFSENNKCILCKEILVEPVEPVHIKINTILDNPVIHNRYQNLFNIRDNEEINYDNEFGNDMDPYIYMHPIHIHPFRIHNIPSLTFCIKIVKLIPAMSIIIIIYEIYNYIG